MARPLANLFIRVGADVKDALKGMSLIDRAAKKTKDGFEDLRTKSFDLRKSWVALAGAGGAGWVAKKTFDLGSAVEETGSKFATVFGESEREVQSFIDTFGTLAGLSNEQAQAITATTGSIVQGMGFAQDASARFSTQVVQLAGDLSSFNNIPIQETSLAIQAALTGEREQLKRLGIVLREVDVTQRALANSGKAVAGELTNQDKATASLQLITERAGFAVGDLARTQDSAANRARQLGADIQNIKESLAVALLPTLSLAVTGFSRFIKGMQIMGAEAAVLVARMNFWKEAAFGTEESTMAANDQLRFMRQAAEQAKLEIVGLSFGLESLNTSMGEVASTGTAPLVVDMSRLTDATTHLKREWIDVGKIAPPTVEALIKPVERVTSKINTLGAAMAASFIDSALSSKLAIRDMVKDMIGQLAKLAIKFAIFKGLSRLFPGSGFVSSLGKSFGFFDGGGRINSGDFGIVGERGPELVQGPATVTSRKDTASMMGGDNVTHITIVGQSGEKLVDTITVRQRRNENLGRVVRIPIPATVVG